MLSKTILKIFFHLPEQKIENLFFYYYFLLTEEVPENAATAEDYRAYDVSVHGAKHVEPYLLQQSHFDAPLGEKRYFSTTQSEHYTPKQIKRIQIDPNSLQLSTLPIGTMGRYIKGSNVGW